MIAKHQVKGAPTGNRNAAKNKGAKSGTVVFQAEKDAEARRLLDLLPARVTRLAKRGLLPSIVQHDGEFRYSVDDLQAWTVEHRRPAALSEEGSRND